MNIRKFLVVIILFGLVKLCHAASAVQTTKDMIFQFPSSNNNQVSIYPCFECPSLSKVNLNTSCLSQALQGGLAIQIIF